MLLALLLALPVPQDTVNQEAIDAAIDRGVAFLSEHFDDGRKLKRINTERSGMRALILYTLLKSGAEKDGHAVRELLGKLAFEEIDGTYDLACLMLALAAHDRVLHRPWMEDLAQQMIEWQHDGEWDYPGGVYDLSNTQYAALGLWAAERCGVTVEPSAWGDMAKTVLEYQDEEGAFSYTRPGKSGYGSMTAAGVGTLALCEMHLAKTENLSDADTKKFTTARKRGLDWLNENFSVETNPRNGGWHYYYLYGLERMGGLAGVPLLGEHDWYAEGAKFLIERQDEEGSWTNGTDLSETCFALLFLRRATSADTKPRGPVTGGGKRADPPKNETEDKTAAVRIAVRGSLPLEMWIDAWGRAETKPLEWDGETGLGPHVSRVEWVANDEVIAVRLGDATLPARGSRFTAKHLFAKTGEVELICRVHVQPPNGAKPKIIESPPLEIEIEQALPSWMSELVAERGANLVQAGKPSARGSSKLRKPSKLGPPLPKRKYEDDLAVDGNARTPWLASLKDKEPKLTVTLGKVQTANVVLISHAQLLAGHELALPESVEVRINKRDLHELPVGKDRGQKLRIDLDEATRVKSIVVILKGRQGDSLAPMGIGEVELRLR